MTRRAKTSGLYRSGPQTHRAFTAGASTRYMGADAVPGTRSFFMSHALNSSASTIARQTRSGGCG